MKKLTGNTEIEDSLSRLDKLTQEEARMASAELLKVTHGVDDKVVGVDDRVKDVQGKVQDVHGDVQDVRSDVQDISSEVRGVDNKLDQANRSLSL
jgi:peptidoglycan hydrolase CwlO-like protein